MSLNFAWPTVDRTVDRTACRWKSGHGSTARRLDGSTARLSSPKSELAEVGVSPYRGEGIAPQAQRYIARRKGRFGCSRRDADCGDRDGRAPDAQEIGDWRRSSESRHWTE